MPSYYTETCLWSIHKQKWIEGPDLPEDLEFGQVVNINQTYALFLFPTCFQNPNLHNDLHQPCIKAYSITFHSNFRDPLILLDDCYFNHDTCPGSSIRTRVQLDAKSFVMENKVYWLVIASFRTIQNVSVRDPNKNYIFHFGLFDTYGLVKKWSEYSNFVQPGFFFLRGQLYFYQIDNKGLMELYQFDLKNLTQKSYIQSISSDFSQSYEKPLIVQTLV